MTLAIAIAALSTTPGQALATDFFPVAAGTKWTYNDTTQPGVDIVYVAKAPVMVGRDDRVARLAVPIEITPTDGVKHINFYRVDTNHVLLVAERKRDEPLESPEVLIQTGDGPQTWQDERNSGSSLEPLELHIVASDQLKPARNVFGKSRAILEVVYDAKTEDKQHTVWIHQVASYAAGVGLIRMDETSTISKRTYKRTQTLVKFEPAETSGGS